MSFKGEIRIAKHAETTFGFAFAFIFFLIKRVYCKVRYNHYVTEVVTHPEGKLVGYSCLGCEWYKDAK